MKHLNGSLKELLILGGLLLALFLFAVYIQHIQYSSSISSFGTITYANVFFLPLIVGVFSIIRFYSKKSNKFLFIGTGFIGVALFDAYDSIMSTMVFSQLEIEQYDYFSTWGWFISRLFLAIFLFLSFWASNREEIRGEKGRFRESTVYFFTWLTISAIFLVLGLVDLPSPYIPQAMNPIISRPFELISAFLFLITFIGYLQKGGWKYRQFDYWFLISLIISFMGQVVFMPFSERIMDLEYFIADLFKTISYVVVLFGLLNEMFILFREAEESRVIIEKHLDDLKKFRAAAENTSDMILITDAKGEVLFSNRASKDLIQYTDDVIKIRRKKSRGATQVVTKEFFDEMQKCLKKKEQSFEKEFVNKDSETIYEEVSVSTILGGKGEVKYYVCIGRDISKLKEIDRAKSEFVSLASHQLRSPLWIINWLVETMNDEDAGRLTIKQREIMGQMTEATGRMARLIKDLLNVSKIEMGTLDKEKKKIDLNHEIEEVLKEFKSEIKDHKVKVETKFNSRLPKLIFGENLVKIIIQNLIDNALKYSPEKNGKIFIRTKNTKNGIVLMVRDNGIGIPKKQQDKIFSKFYRSKNAIEKNPNGTGLGLYIMKSIMDKHNGKIWYETEVGKGTTFFVQFPKK